MSETVPRLLQADWLDRDTVQRLFAVLDGRNGRTRAVGGIVRDTVLDRLRDRTDIDLATELVPTEVMRRAERAGIAAHPTGIEHGTVTLRLGETVAEVTTLRQDVQTDGRHAVVQFGTDWALDARRRDFSMNALYAAMDGTVFDPIGGLTDCLSQRVRFIGDPAQRIAEDGLRVYRFFRFSTSHGQQVFDEPGLVACTEAADRLGHLSAERVGGEMIRILSLPRVANTLAQMERAGLLRLGPDALASLTTYERQVGEGVLDARLAILLRTLDPEVVQGQWRLANGQMTAAVEVRAAADTIIALQVKEAAYRHPKVLPLALDVAAAETGWGEAGKAALLEQLRAVHAVPLPVSGKDLLAAGFVPGPGVGRALALAEQLWIDSGFAVAPAALIADVKKRVTDAS